MRALPTLLAAGIFAGAAVAAGAGTAPKPAFPTLERQFAEARVVPGKALERLIRANQDVSLLRPEEAKDKLLLPPWLRVWWRKNHPEGRYDGADPTGGYPLVLREVLEWMTTHQDLVPGPGAGDEEQSELLAPEAASVSGELRISGAQITPRSESDIRVNPWDPTKIIGASNNISGGGTQAQFYSTDGGTTWGQTNLSLQPGDAFQSDPTVDWTSDGTAWSTTIGIDSSGSILHMRAYKSTDNGATWTFDNTFSGSQTSTDKQLMWVDHSNSSPFKDNIYAIWHNGLPAFMNRRTGPAGAWQTPIQVSGAETTGTAIGDDVKTNAFGDVFGFWPATGNRKIFVVKSTNGGVSYGTPVQIGSTFDSFDIGVPSFNGRKALIYVMGGAYRTALKNLVYATWVDLTGAAGCTAAGNEPGSNVASTCKTRVWFSRSTDGGATWTPAVMVNNQPSLNDQFNQGFAVDEATGALAVVYYDTVNDPGRKKSDLWYQSSFDDGQTWNAAVKITSAQTDEATAGGGQDTGNQYGDYNAVSGYAGLFFPSWTDRRSGAREEIWTAKITDLTCAPPGVPTIGTATAAAPNQIQLSWSNGTPASTSFNVYRAPGSCASPGVFSAVGTAVAGSPFNDNTVSGASTYAYKVTGRDATGHCESVPSGCAQATATGACTLPPSFAGLVSATNGAGATCTTHLSWSAGTANCGGPVRYDVYRGAPGFTPSASNRIAASLVGTTLDDAETLLNGVAYEYIVRARDINNGIAETNSVRRSATPSGAVTFGAFTETFEGAGGFDNAGWSHSALSGATDWAWSTAQSHSPTHAWFSSDPTTPGDGVLTSPPFVAQAGTTLSFWHTYAFETSSGQCFDGGTLEYTSDGALWNVLPDAAFTAGGFNGTMVPSFDNPLGGKRAWCGGTIGALTQVTADLSSLAGNALRLRWHQGDDTGNATATTGWYVDSVSLSGFGTAGVCTTVSGPTGFYTLAPCRVVDTRNPNGTFGGPALAAGATRGFPFAGACGIPADAKAVSVNITVASPGASGFVMAYAAALGSAPATSVMNFSVGTTRANNAVVMLANDGTNDVKIVNGSAGAVQLLIDVNGYFK